MPPRSYAPQGRRTGIPSSNRDQKNLPLMRFSSIIYGRQEANVGTLLRRYERKLHRLWSSDRSERPDGESFRARQRCAPLSNGADSGAALDRLGCAACCDSNDAARPIRSRVPPTARAMDRCRRRDRQSHAGVSDVAVHRDVAGSHESTRAFLPRAGLRWAMQSKAAFPEEHPGRRPPPSTSCPCPAWFFQLSSPFFGRNETAVQKRFAPVELLALVQFRQKCAPNGEPDLLLFPIPQSPPAGRR
jgi:hypothetical protein